MSKETIFFKCSNSSYFFWYFSCEKMFSLFLVYYRTSYVAYIVYVLADGNTGCQHSEC
jgi:hypothetical protein